MIQRQGKRQKGQGKSGLGIFAFCLLPFAFAVMTAPAQAAAPALFFSDLDSGPKTGGENNKGAYVCVWGRNFGSSQGSSYITVGGGQVDHYPVWTQTGNPSAPDKACFQLGPNAQTGPIVMTTAGGFSNGLPFTVRSGYIYFVSTAGSDTSGNGSFGSPWASIKKCKNTMAAGDICYVEDGVTETTHDTYGFLYLYTSGTSGNPKALVAYPGANATIGQLDATVTHASIQGYNGGAPVMYWTIAGFHLIGANQGAFATEGMPSKYFRLVGNKFECPAGNGLTGCAQTSGMSQFEFLGNELTNIGCGAGHTGGLDDGTGNSGQTWQVPCQITAGKTGTTVSSTDGLTITANSYGVFSGQKGDHLILDFGAGPEERIVTVFNASSSGPAPDQVTVSSPFSSTAFSGASWSWRSSTVSKLYHSFYGGTDSHDMELAWNYVHNNSSAHGLNFHSSPLITSNFTNVSAGTPVQVTLANPFNATSGQRIDIPTLTGDKPSQAIPCNPSAAGHLYVQPVDTTHMNLYEDPALTIPVPGTTACSGGYGYWDGYDQYGISLHDNYIDHQNGAGISMASNDPSQGAITIYNNIIANTGCGPNLVEMYPFVGIYLPGYHESGVPGSGSVQVFNNTLYNIGNWTGQYFGTYYGAVFQFDTSVGVNLENNIIQQTGKEYIDTKTGASWSGTNNLIFGGTGGLPAALTNTITADPLFTDAANGNFALQPGSPALGAGANTGQCPDAATPSTWDLGACGISAPLKPSPGSSGPPTVTSNPLAALQVYPNPWRSDKYTNPAMTFAGLVSGTTIKLFTVSGHKVKEIHTDNASITWDLTNDSGDKVASGIYVYLITDSQGDKVKGKVAIIK